MIKRHSSMIRIAMLSVALALICTTTARAADPFSNPYDKAYERAAKLAMQDNFLAAGRSLTAYGAGVPRGKLEHARSYLEAFYFLSAGGARSEAQQALEECIATAPAESDKYSVGNICRSWRDKVAAGDYIARDHARGNARSWLVSNEIPFEESRGGGSSAPPTESIASTTQPPEGSNAPTAQIQTPPGLVQPTLPTSQSRSAPRTGPQYSSCVQVIYTRNDSPAPNTLHVAFKNNCPIAVKIGWSEVAGNQQLGGGGAELRVGAIYNTWVLHKEATGVKYIACSMNAGYNTSPNIPEWYCSPG